MCTIEKFFWLGCFANGRQKIQNQEKGKQELLNIFRCVYPPLSFILWGSKTIPGSLRSCKKILNKYFELPSSCLTLSPCKICSKERVSSS